MIVGDGGGGGVNNTQEMNQWRGKRVGALCEPHTVDEVWH